MIMKKTFKAGDVTPSTLYVLAGGINVFQTVSLVCLVKSVT